MTNHSNHPTITLPLMIAYSDALLPTLMADNKQVPTITSDSETSQTNDPVSMPLLWAVENDSEAEQLNQQLNQQAKQTINKDRGNKNTKDTQANFEIGTLAQLNKQNVRQRYELGCFWLPTLTEEQLQQFIPTIMRYRDLYAAHLLIAIDNSLDLRAYGFTTFDIFEDKALALHLAKNDLDIDSLDTGSLETDSNNKTDSDSKITLWQFNLYDYKRLPNWLNNKYWANPDNWDKHRW